MLCSSFQFPIFERQTDLFFRPTGSIISSPLIYGSNGEYVLYFCSMNLYLLYYYAPDVGENNFGSNFCLYFVSKIFKISQFSQYLSTSNMLLLFIGELQNPIPAKTSSSSAQDADPTKGLFALFWGFFSLLFQAFFFSFHSHSHVIE
jgi:hypothetical protein